MIREYALAQLVTITPTNIVLRRTWRDKKDNKRNRRNIRIGKGISIRNSIHILSQNANRENHSNSSSKRNSGNQKLMELVVDSTGISLEESPIKYVLKHKSKKRRWLKLHVIADYRSKIIVLIDVSMSKKHDVAVLKELLLNEFWS